MKFYELPADFVAQRKRKDQLLTLDALEEFEPIHAFLSERLYPGELFVGDMIVLPCVGLDGENVFYEIVKIAYLCSKEGNIEPIYFVRKQYIRGKKR